MRALALCLFLAACSTAVAGDKAAAPATAPPAAEADGWAAYGTPFSTDTVVTSAADLFASPADFVGKSVRVEGRVADVCQKMGCWMVIAEGDQSMRVLMKDHAFSVDKQGAGSTCQIDGIVEAKTIDPKTVEHFESESAEGAVIPEKQAKSDVVYQFVAAGVRLKK